MADHKQDARNKQGGPGFIMQSRRKEVEELMRYPVEFTLLTQIARRACRTAPQFNPHGLTIGEALVGDYQSIGASYQNYRTARDHLKEWGFATFRPTNKGTIARLLDNRIYDINADAPGNDQVNERRNEQVIEGKRQPPSERNNEQPRNSGAFESTLAVTTNNNSTTQQRNNSGTDALSTRDLRHAVLNEEEREASRTRTTAREDWRTRYEAEELALIDRYNAICVPAGWLPTDHYSPGLSRLAYAFAHDYDESATDRILTEAVDAKNSGDEQYNRPRGAKLIRILARNYDGS